MFCISITTDINDTQVRNANWLLFYSAWIETSGNLKREGKLDMYFRKWSTLVSRVTAHSRNVKGSLICTSLTSLNTPWWKKKCSRTSLSYVKFCVKVLDSKLFSYNVISVKLKLLQKSDWVQTYGDIRKLFCLHTIVWYFDTILSQYQCFFQPFLSVEWSFMWQKNPIPCNFKAWLNSVEV